VVARGEAAGVPGGGQGHEGLGAPEDAALPHGHEGVGVQVDDGRLVVHAIR
jgi:hypothetical protein